MSTVCDYVYPGDLDSSFAGLRCGQPEGDFRHVSAYHTHHQGPQNLCLFHEFDDGTTEEKEAPMAQQRIIIRTEVSAYEGTLGEDGDTIHIERRLANDGRGPGSVFYAGDTRLRDIYAALASGSRSVGVTYDDRSGRYTIAFLTGVEVGSHTGAALTEFDALAEDIMRLGTSIGFEGISKSKGMQSVEAILADLRSAITRV